MKTTLMKKALGVLALSALGFAATGAQADWGRGGYDYGQGSPAHERGEHDFDRGGYAFRQSQAFSAQIDARQDRQIGRIQAGARDGRLTRAEFRDLMLEQREIRAMERHFRADGFIDAREFQRLDRALDIASRNIMAEKHDRQARYADGYTPRFN